MLLLGAMHCPQAGQMRVPLVEARACVSSSETYYVITNLGVDSLAWLFHRH